MATVSDVKVYKNKKYGQTNDQGRTSKVMGYGSFVLNGDVRINYTLVDGSKGEFLSLPQEKNTRKQKDDDPDYWPLVKFVNPEVQDQALKAVQAAYEQQGGSTQSSSSAPADDLPF